VLRCHETDHDNRIVTKVWGSDAVGCQHVECYARYKYFSRWVSVCVVLCLTCPFVDPAHFLDMLYIPISSKSFFTSWRKLKIFLIAVPVYWTVWHHVTEVYNFGMWCFDSTVCIFQLDSKWKQKQIFATGFTVSTIQCLNTVSRHLKNRCCGSCQRLASQAGSGCHSGHAPLSRMDHTTWRKQRRTLISVSWWIVTGTNFDQKNILENIMFCPYALFVLTVLYWLWHFILFWESNINYQLLTMRY
jgi:hypothetical protein